MGVGMVPWLVGVAGASEADRLHPESSTIKTRTLPMTIQNLFVIEALLNPNYGS
jgi:hypothetical protein